MRFILLLISTFVLIINVYGHSGGTDSNGGHFNRSTGSYHYHNSGYRPSPPDLSNPSKAKIPQGKYWINSSSGTRHKKGCRWYGTTKSGFYSSEVVGKACGNCGG
ncbi:MAG: YHYH domain-containing protein [Verrucomicrobia bacterium]|nr:YHYH domain-containing protein [Verrucomicrobiota bacterium]